MSSNIRIQSQLPLLARPLSASAARVQPHNRTPLQRLGSTNATQLGGGLLTAASLVKLGMNILNRNDDVTWSSYFTAAIGAIGGLFLFGFGSRFRTEALTYDLFGTAATHLYNKASQYTDRSPLSIEQISDMKVSSIEFATMIDATRKKVESQFLKENGHGPYGAESTYRDSYVAAETPESPDEALADKLNQIALNTLNQLFNGDGEEARKFKEVKARFEASMNEALGLIDGEMRLELDLNDKIVFVSFRTTQLFEDGSGNQASLYRPFMKMPVSCSQFCTAITETLRPSMDAVSVENYSGVKNTEHEAQYIVDANGTVINAISRTLSVINSERPPRAQDDSRASILKLAKQMQINFLDTMSGRGVQAGYTKINRATGVKEVKPVVPNIAEFIPSGLKSWFAGLIGIGGSGGILGGINTVKNKAGELVAGKSGEGAAEKTTGQSSGSGRGRVDFDSTAGLYFKELGINPRAIQHSSQLDEFPQERIKNDRVRRLGLVTDAIEPTTVQFIAVKMLIDKEFAANRNNDLESAANKRLKALLALKQFDAKAYAQMYKVLKMDAENPDVNEPNLLQAAYDPRLTTDFPVELLQANNMSIVREAFGEVLHLPSDRTTDESPGELPNGRVDPRLVSNKIEGALTKLYGREHELKLRRVLAQFYIQDHIERVSAHPTIESFANYLGGIDPSLREHITYNTLNNKLTDLSRELYALRKPTRELEKLQQVNVSSEPAIVDLGKTNELQAKIAENAAKVIEVESQLAELEQEVLSRQPSSTCDSHAVAFANTLYSAFIGSVYNTDYSIPDSVFYRLKSESQDLVNCLKFQQLTQKDEASSLDARRALASSVNSKTTAKVAEYASALNINMDKIDDKAVDRFINFLRGSPKNLEADAETFLKVIGHSDAEKMSREIEKALSLLKESQAIDIRNVVKCLLIERNKARELTSHSRFVAGSTVKNGTTAGTV